LAREGSFDVSDSDSFINEVSEEVRRDRLYGHLRRYGWIAVLCVLVLVGGAAFNEYRKAQATAAAQATGDALFDALSESDPAARAAALSAIDAGTGGAVVQAMITANSQQGAGDLEGAVQTLTGVATNGDLSPTYRDLAALKAAMLDAGDAAARRQSLEALAQPGALYQLLAMEQLALLDLSEGNAEGAIERLSAIIEDAGVTRGLRERAQNLMVALGAEPPQAAPSN